MHHTPKKIHRILLLSVLYAVVIGSVLLAFPKNVWYNQSPTWGMYLWTAQKDNLWLPVNIELWQWNTATNTTQSSSTKQVTAPIVRNIPKPLKSNQKVTTCAQLKICDKVKFSEWYSDSKKAAYYSNIIDVIDSLQRWMSRKTMISDSLYSLTLSNSIGDRRWWGWSKTIIINTKDISNMQEFREILTHELWHIIDLGAIVWSSKQYDKQFTLWGQSIFGIDDTSLDFYRISWTDISTRKADATYLDFVWWYAMSNPYEDFAESFNMYIRHNDVFRAMALSSQKLQKKYNFIKSIVWDTILWTDWQNVGILNANAKRRPWDSTRMSLE